MTREQALELVQRYQDEAKKALRAGQIREKLASAIWDAEKIGDDQPKVQAILIGAGFKTKTLEEAYNLKTVLEREMRQHSVSALVGGLQLSTSWSASEHELVLPVLLHVETLLHDIIAAERRALDAMERRLTAEQQADQARVSWAEERRVLLDAEQAAADAARTARDEIASLQGQLRGLRGEVDVALAQRDAAREAAQVAWLALQIVRETLPAASSSAMSVDAALPLLGGR